MGLEQALPDLHEGKGIKDIIIRVLSEEWPLSSNEVYNRAKRKYGLDSTYQAVHKILKQLVSQGVLVREGKQYSISIKWAEKIEKFSKDLKTTLISHKPFYLEGLSDFREETGMQTFIFDSFGAAEEYRKTLQKQYIEKSGPKPPYVGQSRHLKSPVVFSEKSLSILNTIKKTQLDCYLLITGKTKIDEWCADYYRNEFVRVKTGCDVAKNCDTMIMGDVITQMYIPDEIQEQLDKVYESGDKVSDINIPKFNKDIYEKKIKTKFVVFKNAEMAEQIRRQAIDLFKKNVSLFDIDGTLVDGLIPVEFATHLANKNTFSTDSLKKIQKTMAGYRSGKIRYNVAIKEIVNAYAKGIKGQKESLIREEAKKFADEEKINFFNYAAGLLGLLKQKGVVIAVTGAPIEVIEALRTKIPFDIIYATKLEIKGGEYTGSVVSNTALGEKKEESIREYFEKEGGRCLFGFGDTLSDLTLLERAEIPIALNPNKELKSTAIRRGWRILTQNNDVISEIAKITKNQLRL